MSSGSPSSQDLILLSIFLSKYIIREHSNYEQQQLTDTEALQQFYKDILRLEIDAIEDDFVLPRFSWGLSVPNRL